MAEIRLLKGKKVSDKSEVERISNDALETPSPILLGSASNVEVVKADSYLYDAEEELYGQQRLYMPAAGMNMVNLVIGPMGSGKTNFLCNIINEFSNNNQIINDPKQEYLQWFYEEDKGDLILGFPDQRSVMWDILGEIAEDPQMGQLIFKNMLMAARANDTKGMEWVTYAVKWLTKMATIIIDKVQAGQIAYTDIAAEIVRQFSRFKKEVSDGKTGMQSDAIGTAEPAFSVLFQMYHIGKQDARRFVTIKEIMQARRVFLINAPKFAEKLNMVNNALMAMMINAYLSRDNVKRGDLDKYTLFVLDEYLTFKLDEETEKNLLTLCRSKGLCVFLGMQYLPTDPQKVENLTASRYLTVCYKADNAFTAKEISELTEEIKYQRQEVNVVVSEKGGLSLTSDTSLNETWYDIETRQVSKDMIMNLSAYTAFVEINDKKYGVVRTFIRPPLFDDTVFEPGFIYSDVARTAPNLSDFA